MRARQSLYATSATVAKTFDLHVSEMALLATLGKYGPMSMGQLAELSFSSAPNATYTVRGLEKRGLAKRERSRESNRNVNVSLTTDGKKLYKKTYAQTVGAVNAQLAEKLNKQERKTLGKLLVLLNDDSPDA